MTSESLNRPAAPSHAMEPGTRGPARAEPIELTYARHTRNATVFIAIIAGAAALITLIGVIVLAVQVDHLDNAFSNLSNSSSSSNCLSQGGTDPSC